MASWRDAVQPALRVLLQQDEHLDPHLELLRLSVENQDIAANNVTVTLVLDGALVTGTVVSTETWERLHLSQIGQHDPDLRRAVREALAHLDQAAEDGRRRRRPDPRFLHLRDVTVRSGRTARRLPAWRGLLASVSGWSVGEPDEH
ncbi:hypothetical protein ACIQOV_08300 [Kitasatospora sp. NPDC091257]|uniref:hypothetical protein n=1 Tax=Kitasatospora sp. NPDC091257 TaxID=3364084 RepID=UPI003804D34B